MPKSLRFVTETKCLAWGLTQSEGGRTYNKWEPQCDDILQKEDH